MLVLNTTAPRTQSFEERPEPVLAPGEALVETAAASICGSDIHLYRGTHPYTNYPMVFGHEAAGVVREVAAGVTRVAPGDRVVLEPLIPCGRCAACRVGRGNCCTETRMIGISLMGAMAERFATPAESLYSVPDGFPFRLASLVEPFSIGFQAVSRGEVCAADRVVIFGAGPIGLTILCAAKERGAQVAITDLIDRRLELARQLGADLTVNSQDETWQQSLRDWTDGDGPSVVIEAVGQPATIEAAVDLVAAAGRVVIVGVTTKKFALRGVDMTKKELTVFGSRNNLGHYPEVIRYVADHPDVVEAMVTHTFPFAQAIDAFQLADQHPTECCKVVLEFQDRRSQTGS